MSNSRKRNLKKLARNIITGTALAAGGLSNTSAAEAQKQPGVTNAGLLGTSALLATAVVGTGYFLTNRIGLRMDAEQQLKQKENDWNELHVKTKEAEIQRQNDTGIDDKKIIHLNDYFNWERSRFGKTADVKPDAIRQVIKECLDNNSQNQIILLRDIANGYDGNAIDDARKYEGCRKAVYNYINKRKNTKTFSAKVLEAATKLKENITNITQLKNCLVGLSALSGTNFAYNEPLANLRIYCNPQTYVLNCSGQSWNGHNNVNLQANSLRVLTNREGQATLAHQLAGECFCPKILQPFLSGCFHASPVVFPPSIVLNLLGNVSYNNYATRDNILNTLTTIENAKSNVRSNKFFSGIMLHLNDFKDEDGIFIELQNETAGDRVINGGEVNEDIKKARKLISEILLTGEGELNKIEAEKDGLEDY